MDFIGQKQNQLKNLSNHESRLKMIYCWVKGSHISGKEFIKLIDYLDEVEEIKDHEFEMRRRRDQRQTPPIPIIVLG